MIKPRTVHKQAIKAMRQAVRKVVVAHRKTGRPLVVWKKGKVARVSADKVKV